MIEGLVFVGFRRLQMWGIIHGRCSPIDATLGLQVNVYRNPERNSLLLSTLIWASL